MPTDGTPDPATRITLTFRSTWGARDALDEAALAEGLIDADGQPNRSEMIRLLLARGRATWQRGWRTPGWIDPSKR